MLWSSTGLCRPRSWRLYRRRPGGSMSARCRSFHRVPQDAINALLVDLARKGLDIVRLKGGDPMIFGRGSEEALMPAGGRNRGQLCAGHYRRPRRRLPQPACRSPIAGWPRVCAMSPVIAPAMRRWISTGPASHRRRPRSSSIWDAANIAEISSQLMRHGLPGTLPVLAVASATTPRELRMVSTLESVGTDVALAALPAPVLFIIGHVVSLHECATSPLPHDICDDRMRVAVHA